MRQEEKEAELRAKRADQKEQAAQEQQDFQNKQLK